MPPLSPLYPETDTLPLLAETSGRYRKLKTDEERTDQIVLAELLLDLKEPALTGRPADELMYAIALQINFQLEQGFLSAQITQNLSTGTGGNTATTTYRDRHLHPGAAAIVRRVTGRQGVRFESPMRGV